MFLRSEYNTSITSVCEQKTNFLITSLNEGAYHKHAKK
jgi:hypothetical protein